MDIQVRCGCKRTRGVCEEEEDGLARAGVARERERLAGAGFSVRRFCRSGGSVVEVAEARVGEFD